MTQCITPVPLDDRRQGPLRVLDRVEGRGRQRRLRAAIERHLRVDATTCPFCQRSSILPATALALTLVAGVAGVTLVGCGGDDVAATEFSASVYGGPPPTTDASVTATTSDGSATAYGGPPPDSESGTPTTSSTTSSSGTDATTATDTDSTTGTGTDTTTGSTTGTGTDSTTDSTTDTGSTGSTDTGTTTMGSTTG